MNAYKVYTGNVNIGKSVRFILFIFIAALGTNSCGLLDEPDTADVIDNVIGTWKCQESSTNYGDQNYEVVISKTSDMSVNIKGFFDNDITVYAEIEGYIITIPTQTKGGYTISGTGTIAPGYKKIEWSYTVDDVSEITSITAVYTPK
jgi:hypothetical protein